MIDSGSSFSLVSTKFLQKNCLNLPVTKVEKYETVITANGESISLVHTVDLSICISGFTMPYTFFVCDQLSDRFPIIIGLDYLEKYNCSIDFHSGFVSFDNELVMAPLLLTTHASQPLRCENSVTIPPFSEMIVVLHAPYKFNNKQLYVEQFNPSLGMGSKTTPEHPCIWSIEVKEGYDGFHFFVRITLYMST